MKQSKLYTKTRKTLPRDEVARNAQLLLKAGFIHKEMAGVYAYLPLGLRVLKKIEQIIREEMDAIGGQEVLLTSLQDPSLWKKNDRWDDKKVDIWFKDRQEKFGFAWSHEEPMVNMAKHHIGSYKDLPAYIYQFQTKFRNEPRAKSGLLRGREFLMKDLYSFSADEQGLNTFYEKCIGAYKKIFKRVGIGEITYLTFASGGTFTKYSHEFQTVNEAGEDAIYLDRRKKVAINKEVYSDKILKTLGIKKSDLKEERGIEVGNIFKFGTNYSEKLGLTYNDKRGSNKLVYLGSYGIGLGRLMAAVVESLSDKDGIVWPKSIAPYRVHLIELRRGLGTRLYQKLSQAGAEVLYDDRDVSAGEKLKDSDLIGIPLRLVVSEKTGTGVELKQRTSKVVQLLTQDAAIRKSL